MRRLLSGYATNYNIRNQRSGYIHLNPAKAKILKSIDELDTYPWPGHAAIMRKDSNDWQNIDEVLGQYSVQKAAALICYWGNSRFGISSTILGSRLNISQSSVSRAVKRGSEYCKENDVELKID